MSPAGEGTPPTPSATNTKAALLFLPFGLPLFVLGLLVLDRSGAWSLPAAVSWVALALVFSFGVLPFFRRRTLFLACHACWSLDVRPTLPGSAGNGADTLAEQWRCGDCGGLGTRAAAASGQLIGTDLPSWPRGLRPGRGAARLTLLTLLGAAGAFGYLAWIDCLYLPGWKAVGSGVLGLAFLGLGALGMREGGPGAWTGLALILGLSWGACANELDTSEQARPHFVSTAALGSGFADLTLSWVDEPGRRPGDATVPGSPHSESGAQASQVHLRVSPEGVHLQRGRLIPAGTGSAALGSALRATWDKGPSPTAPSWAVARVDASVAAGTLGQVLDSVRASGIPRVRLELHGPDGDWFPMGMQLGAAPEGPAALEVSLEKGGALLSVPGGATAEPLPLSDVTPHRLDRVARALGLGNQPLDGALAWTVAEDVSVGEWLGAFRALAQAAKVRDLDANRVRVSAVPEPRRPRSTR